MPSSNHTAWGVVVCNSFESAVDILWYLETLSMLPFGTWGLYFLWLQETVILICVAGWQVCGQPQKYWGRDLAVHPILLAPWTQKHVLQEVHWDHQDRCVFDRNCKNIACFFSYIPDDLLHILMWLDLLATSADEPVCVTEVKSYSWMYLEIFVLVKISLLFNQLCQSVVWELFADCRNNC